MLTREREAEKESALFELGHSSAVSGLTVYYRMVFLRFGILGYSARNCRAEMSAGGVEEAATSGRADCRPAFSESGRRPSVLGRSDGRR